MNFLLRLADPWAYLVVGALAAAEASIFVGLVIPGEAAVILGGVLASQGRADLTPMLFAACAGAIIGDSIGYEVGRFFGPRLQRSAIGRKVGEERWERAHAYVRRLGGRAVFFGRFAAVLRALVPSISGSAEIPYPTFLLFNVAGGLTWAIGFTLVGYAAGSSWDVAQHWIGAATLIVAGLIVFGLVVGFGARWVAAHREEIRAALARFNERPLIARFRRRFRSQIDFVERRFDPRERAGLFLTVGAVLAIAVGWLFGIVLQDVLSRDDLALIDSPVARYFSTHRVDWLTDVMKVITFFASTPFIIVAMAIVAVVAFRKTKDLRLSGFMCGVVAGSISLSNLIKALVDRPRPNFAPAIHAAGSAFPSGHATAGAAFWGGLAYVVTRGARWRKGVWIWTGAAVIAVLVAFSRVYLGVHWLTDVLGGLALGSFWVVVVATVSSVLARRRAG